MAYFLGEIMQSVNFKLEYEIAEECTSEAIPVIVVAAGNSTRMNGINKQLVPLCGIPTIIHTLLKFEQSTCISKIVVVTQQDLVGDIHTLAENYLITKLKDVVVGGNTRQQSVINGLNCIKDEKYVLIHDGARPLVSENTISNVFNAKNHADCVVCAIPITDTVKKTADDTVCETIDRTNLISVQTPQSVDVKKYLDILNTTDVNLLTDDASVFEQNGLSVKWVMGDKSNIKITTRDDIALAQFYLEQRGEY